MRGYERAMKLGSITWRTVGLCFLWLGASWLEDKLDAALYRDAVGEERDS